MSLKRVVLIAAMLALISPAVALADGLTFVFVPGSNNLSVPRPFVLGSSGAMIGTLQLSYITSISGPVPFGPAIPPTYGTIPTSPWSPPYPDLGSMSFTTGSAISTSATSVVFGAGGSVNIVSDSSGNLQTATGGAIPNGTPLFTGYFSGPTTMTQLNAPSATCAADPTCVANFFFQYSLVGPIEGIIDPAVLSHFNLGTNGGATGLLVNLVFGFRGLDDDIGSIEQASASVVVPEPGTLALFGTGLVSIAGFIRRRLKA